MYAGNYQIINDTVKVSFLLDHYPPNISYMLLRGDTFYIKTTDTTLLKLPVKYYSRGRLIPKDGG
jgi:hypothetical protein